MKQEQNSKELIRSISSKWNLIKIEKNIQKLEEKVVTLCHQQGYTFHKLIKFWMLSPFSNRHKDIITIILLGCLISPLTTEVERSFTFIKLIWTGLRNRLFTKNLSHCMRISKSRDLRADEYEQVKINKQTNKQEKQQKKGFIVITLKNYLPRCVLIFSYLLFFNFLISSSFTRKKYLQWTHVMLCLEFTTSFLLHKYLFAAKIFLTPHPLLWGKG